MIVLVALTAMSRGLVRIFCGTAPGHTLQPYGLGFLSETVVLIISVLISEKSV